MADWLWLDQLCLSDESRVSWSGKAFRSPIISITISGACKCDCATATYERNVVLVLAFHCTKTIQVSLLANALRALDRKLALARLKGMEIRFTDDEKWGFRSLSPQLKDDYSLTPINDLANVPDNVVVIFILDQILERLR